MSEVGAGVRGASLTSRCTVMDVAIVIGMRTATRGVRIHQKLNASQSPAKLGRLGDFSQRGVPDGNGYFFPEKILLSLSVTPRVRGAKEYHRIYAQILAHKCYDIVRFKLYVVVVNFRDFGLGNLRTNIMKCEARQREMRL